MNATRTASGCPALTADAGLAGSAAAHSAQMRDEGGLSAKGLPRRAAAVASGLSDPDAVVRIWLASPEDRAALTHCSRTSAGVGVVDGWWTLLLA